MSLRMERSGMTQSQGLGLLRFTRNDCKYFCPITYVSSQLCVHLQNNNDLGLLLYIIKKL